jgi:hypothetical protein
MSPIKMLPGPLGTDTGEPGALANNCCDASEGVLPEGHEIKIAAASIAADILTREVMPFSFRSRT